MTYEDYLNFRCPRYEDFPDMLLYADQVISVISKYYSCFFEDGKLPITQNMINNYVKQKIVKPPINKKYDRVHLSYLSVVCLLKKLMNLSDLCDGMEYLHRERRVCEIYDTFCDELEASFREVFGGEIAKAECENDEIKLIRSVTRSFANLCLTETIIKEKSGKKHE